MAETDTNFVTLLTPLGPGGLAAVRVFGGGALSLLRKLAVPERAGGLPATADRMTLVRVVDPGTGETIDQAIVRVLP
ncbi:MAG: hypothetical protein PHU85_16200, partial [Phycisphaerae bacterium]|nr:hypothetical protein [Phycisphaerae bacterium]